MSTIIEMPKLSDTMTVGTVVKWFKQVGDEVANGDILAEIETDKATMELENFDDGFILQLLATEGDEVEIGKPLAVIGSKGEEVFVDEETSSNSESSDSSAEESVDSAKNDDSKTQDSTPIPEIKEDFAINQNSGQRPVLASPLAKKIAKQNNIDLTTIVGSGPSGRITKKDLKLDSFNSRENEEVSKLSGDIRNEILLQSKSIPVSKIRSIIATRLLESKQSIPHFYLQKEINAEPLRIARESINHRLSSGSTQPTVNKVSLNDLILLATANALVKVPEINTSWNEEEIVFHGTVNLAFGVAIEEGLVTPVIRNANSLSLKEISAQAKLLINKARNKKLSPDEMQGSTFTVTNLGMFGIDFFNGIINPPNAAILSVGAIIKKPLIAQSGAIIPGETMTLGLSCDHRLVDGAIGANFLQILSQLLESPASLLV